MKFMKKSVILKISTKLVEVLNMVIKEKSPKNFDDFLNSKVRSKFLKLKKKKKLMIFSIVRFGQNF